MKGQSRAALFRTTIFLTVATFALVLSGVAAPLPGAPNSAKAPSADTAVTIPFELVTRHIMVKVKVNNSRPLSFVLDTGDKVGIVDVEVAKELGLKLEGQVRVGGAGAETLAASMVKDGTWTLPGLEGFSQPLTLALPLGRLAARFGHDFDGIIGSDFIRQFVVEVDYQNRVLKIYDKDKFAYSGTGESIPIQLNGQGFPLLEGEVAPLGGDPIKGKFVLDLGSGGSLALMSPVVSEHNLLGNGLKTIHAIGVGGAGGQSTGQIGRVQSLQIGKFKVPNTLTLFSEDKSGAMATRALIGNIGQQIASKFKIFLDYSHERIILEPNSTFLEPMERLGSGMVLLADGPGHATIRVTDVLEKSPASEAGVQKDDIIISVDGKAASELNLTKLSEMFERPQSRKLAIKRGEQALQITLTPRKLI
jgi:aspartyl protease/PDZ domain-containing protein